jgi:hypothetical protein
MTIRIYIRRVHILPDQVAHESGVGGSEGSAIAVMLLGYTQMMIMARWFTVLYLTRLARFINGKKDEKKEELE